MPVGPISQATINVITTPPTTLSQKFNIMTVKSTSALFALNDVVDLKMEELKAKADAIDAYFANRDMPLAGMGMKMVEEAEKNDIDWRLLPAIAVRESTGGKYDCKRVENNPFGWGSCRIGFKSNKEAIEVVAKNLGGNNPNTARHYDNKSIKEILRAYNPPQIVPRYAEQVISIMNTIGKEDVLVTVNS